MISCKYVFHNFSVYGHKEEHLNHLKKCMTKCRDNGINLNLEKCAFCINYIKLLGHIVFENGLLVDPWKINIIMNMPIPTSVTKFEKIQGYKVLLTIFQNLCN
jgi:hypothetical protein